MPELNLAAPSLDGVGERLRADWLVKWIADPQAVRPFAHMPVVFRENAAQSAADITSYLTAGISDIEVALEATPEQVRAGGALWRRQAEKAGEGRTNRSARRAVSPAENRCSEPTSRDIYPSSKNL